MGRFNRRSFTSFKLDYYRVQKRQVECSRCNWRLLAPPVSSKNALRLTAYTEIKGNAGKAFFDSLPDAASLQRRGRLRALVPWTELPRPNKKTKLKQRRERQNLLAYWVWPPGTIGMLFEFARQSKEYVFRGFRHMRNRKTTRARREL